MWLGRWGQLQTLEHYVQEFAAENFLDSLVPAAQAWVRTAAPRALELFWHQRLQLFEAASRPPRRPGQD